MATAVRETRIRAAGNTISGTVVSYGDTAPSVPEHPYPESFLPGSIKLADSVWVDLHHDRERAIGWFPGGGLTLTDTPEALTFSLEVPPIPAGRKALAEVESGKITGASVTYTPVREREGVQEEVILQGFALVRNPAFKASTVRVRAGRWATAELKPGGRRNCKCVGPDCEFIEFDDDAFDDSIVEINAGERDLVAHTGGFGPEQVLATVFAGTLRLRKVDDVVTVELDDAVAGTPAGAALAASNDATMPVLRPLLDDARSEFTEQGNVRRYSRAWLQSLLFKTAQFPEGWSRIDIGHIADADPPRKRADEDYLLCL